MTKRTTFIGSFLILVGLLLGVGLTICLRPDYGTVLTLHVRDVNPPHYPLNGTATIWGIESAAKIAEIEALKKRQRSELPSATMPDNQVIYSLVNLLGDSAAGLRREGELTVKDGKGSLRLKAGVKLISYCDEDFNWTEVVWLNDDTIVTLDAKNAHYLFQEVATRAAR